MTTPEALNTLADRVEREEPSRYLDADIEEAEMGAATADPPYYTTSLDAAVTLVPPEYANAWSAGDNSGEYRIFGRLGYEHEATGLTPAAALTAAALRARAADMQARAALSPTSPPPEAPPKVRTQSSRTHPMTKPDELLELANRCEREEASAALDKAIDLALGFCPHLNTTYEAVQGDSGRTCDDCGADSWGNRNAKGRRLHDSAPAYTTSLDAALTLVPEGWAWLHSSFDVMTCVKLTDDDKEWPPRVHGTGKTLPLALCAAALRARAAMNELAPASPSHPSRSA